MNIAFFAVLFGSIAGLVYLFRFLMDKRTEKIISDRTKASEFSKKHYDVEVSKYSGLLFNIGLAMSLAATLFVFEWKSYEDLDLVDFITLDESIDEVFDIPPTIIETPPPPKVVKHPVIVEVIDEKEVEEIEILIDVPVDDPIAIIDQVDDEPEVEEVIPETFIIVETPAKPMGGYPAFYKFIKKKLKYPKQARRMGVEGKVYVEFIIDETGEITNVKALKGIGAGCDEEAKRVMKLAPKWTVPKQRGVPVKQKIVVPIVFKLG
jgi:protein TonB